MFSTLKMATLSLLLLSSHIGGSKAQQLSPSPKLPSVVIDTDIQRGKGIYAALMKYCNALKRKDIDAAMSIYTADFKQVTSDLKPVNNKEQLKQVLTKLARQTASFEVTPNMVRHTGGPQQKVRASFAIGLLKKVTYKTVMKPGETYFAWSSMEMTDWVKTKAGWKLKLARQLQDQESNEYLDRLSH